MKFPDIDYEKYGVYEELKEYKESLKNEIEGLYLKKDHFSKRLKKYQKLRDERFMCLWFSPKKKLKRVENICNQTGDKLSEIKRKISSLESTIYNLEKDFQI